MDIASQQSLIFCVICCVIHADIYVCVFAGAFTFRRPILETLSRRLEVVKSALFNSNGQSPAVLNEVNLTVVFVFLCCLNPF